MAKDGKRGLHKTFFDNGSDLCAVPRIIALAERAGNLYAILYCARAFDVLPRAKHPNRANARASGRKSNSRRRGNKIVPISKQSRIKEAKKKLAKKPKRKKWERPAQHKKKAAAIPTIWEGYPKTVPVLQSHKFQDIADYNMRGSLVCYLSGEPIVRQKDITTEHYVPKSIARPGQPNYAELHAIVTAPYNLHPAIKIVNNIKGNLLPCEWENQKTIRVSTALQKYNLDAYERGLLKKLLLVWGKDKPTGKPCNKCALWLYKQCNGSGYQR